MQFDLTFYQKNNLISIMQLVALKVLNFLSFILKFQVKIYLNCKY